MHPCRNVYLWILWPISISISTMILLIWYDNIINITYSASFCRGWSQSVASLKLNAYLWQVGLGKWEVQVLLFIREVFVWSDIIIILWYLYPLVKIIIIRHFIISTVDLVEYSSIIYYATTSIIIPPWKYGKSIIL